MHTYIPIISNTRAHAHTHTHTHYRHKDDRQKTKSKPCSAACFYMACLTRTWGACTSSRYVRTPVSVQGKDQTSALQGRTVHCTFIKDSSVGIQSTTTTVSWVCAILRSPLIQLGGLEHVSKVPNN